MRGEPHGAQQHAAKCRLETRQDLAGEHEAARIDAPGATEHRHARPHAVRHELERWRRHSPAEALHQPL